MRSSAREGRQAHQKGDGSASRARGGERKWDVPERKKTMESRKRGERTSAIRGEYAGEKKGKRDNGRAL